ncbi:hypothetical protein Ciccas_012470 [Cichlidogyrus casuarinus]|uniref:Uncharacterized protein n=1 Tax=Cichlidogyrus casuarinus TaxID=1844966 RepID=A0ABD2PPQ0_9PLAT
MKQLARLCGNKTGVQVVSHEEQLFVVFTSGPAGPKPSGFEAKFEYVRRSLLEPTPYLSAQAQRKHKDAVRESQSQIYRSQLTHLAPPHKDNLLMDSQANKSQRQETLLQSEQEVEAARAHFSSRNVFSTEGKTGHLRSPGNHAASTESTVHFIGLDNELIQVHFVSLLLQPHPQT